jgi:hypothetical protein
MRGADQSRCRVRFSRIHQEHHEPRAIRAATDGEHMGSLGTDYRGVTTSRDGHGARTT